MQQAPALVLRQPWWLRHAAALVALGGALVVFLFSLNVWLRLVSAYDVAYKQAYADLDSFSYAATVSLGAALKTALHAEHSGPHEPHTDVDEEEPAHRVVTGQALSAVLQQHTGSAALPASPRGYLLAGADGQEGSLLFARPLGPAEYLLVEYPASWLRSHALGLLGQRRAGIQVLTPDREPVTWASHKTVGGEASAALGEGELLEQQTARGPGASEQHTRFFLSTPKALPDGWGFVRVAVVEAEMLEQYYGRWKASVWLVPLLTVVVLGLVLIAGYALRRVQRNEAELHRRALTDALTGLPNRATFTLLLEAEVTRTRANAEPLGLLFLDLDNFKYVNDTLGHDGGDQLLQVVAERLCAGVREGDTVCRLGGDEFVVVLANLRDGDEALLAANRVLRTLTKSVLVKGTTLVPQASIGVAVFGEDADNRDELTRAADMALYEAKAAGKSCAVRFTPKLAHATARFAQVTQELQLAIERHELFVEFQPKYFLDGNRLSGFEALVRWQHPQRGLIMPGEFIGIAETAGLIGLVGNSVMEQVVRQLRAWYDAGMGWQVVAINVSAVQLRDKAAVHLLRRLLREHEVPGACIQVELTESALVEDVDNAVAIIDELKAMGVTLAVDDFGTGYSSLHALQRFKVDFLKVDRSFVQSALTEVGSLEICRAVVQLGHSLGMRIIAEGIETEAQRACMQELGCEEGQGYLLGRPKPAHSATLCLMAQGQERGVLTIVPMEGCEHHRATACARACWGLTCALRHRDGGCPSTDCSQAQASSAAEPGLRSPPRLVA